MFRIQTPTVSPAPTSSPSFCIDLAVVYDNYPGETSWELHRVFGDGVNREMVNSHRASEGDTSREESICLLEGKYEFTLYDAIGVAYMTQANILSHQMW